MKKLFPLLLITLLLSGCMGDREDCYVFSFDSFSIAPGYDDVEYMSLVFDMDLPDKLHGKQKLKDQDVFFWGKYLASIDIENSGKKQIDTEKARVTKLVFYLSNYPASVYKLGDIELSESVKENCEKFSGEYVERNGYACVFGKKSAGKKHTVILYGDIFGIDQDRLDHVEITVE